MVFLIRLGCKLNVVITGYRNEYDNSNHFCIVSLGDINVYHEIFTKVTKIM